MKNYINVENRCCRTSLLYKISEDSVGFNAKMIMKEWKKKNLTFPKLKDGKLIWERNI